jgi:hypothetical protein
MEKKCSSYNPDHKQGQATETGPTYRDEGQEHQYLVAAMAQEFPDHHVPLSFRAGKRRGQR